LLRIESELTLSSPEFCGQTDSVSEIEFCILYVVAERWILGCILRFMHAKNHYSDTLRDCHLGNETGQTERYRCFNDDAKLVNVWPVLLSRALGLPVRDLPG
jgi:hypothetical protein